MSDQGLEVIESSSQKTHEWLNQVAELARLEKRDAYKVLRAVLQTVRDRLPMNDTVHFAAQLPMFLRGLFYEGWEPAKVPIKMSVEEFLAAVQEKVVTDRVIDPLRLTQAVLAVMATHVGLHEMAKVKHAFPKDMQGLFPPAADGL